MNRKIYQFGVLMFSVGLLMAVLGTTVLAEDMTGAWTLTGATGSTKSLTLTSKGLKFTGTFDNRCPVTGTVKPDKKGEFTDELNFRAKCSLNFEIEFHTTPTTREKNGVYRGVYMVTGNNDLSTFTMTRNK